MDPGDNVVVGGVLVDVAGRELRLADAAQPGDRLRDERPPLGGERPLERVELVAAAGERLQPRRDPEPELHDATAARSGIGCPTKLIQTGALTSPPNWTFW
jgi:hypothetical protein